MERVRRAAVVTGLALGLWSGVALADQKLGVDVYKKAELLPAETALVKKKAGVDAGCYRTADRTDAVGAFYQRAGFATVEANVLRRGRVDVVLRPPAANPRTGVVSRYTAFCIMQTIE